MAAIKPTSAASVVSVDLKNNFVQPTAKRTHSLMTFQNPKWKTSQHILILNRETVDATAAPRKKRKEYAMPANLSPEAEQADGFCDLTLLLEMHANDDLTQALVKSMDQKNAFLSASTTESVELVHGRSQRASKSGTDCDNDDGNAIQVYMNESDDSDESDDCDDCDYCADSENYDDRADCDDCDDPDDSDDCVNSDIYDDSDEYDLLKYKNKLHCDAMQKRCEQLRKKIFLQWLHKKQLEKSAQAALALKPPKPKQTTKTNKLKQDDWLEREFQTKKLKSDAYYKKKQQIAKQMQLKENMTSITVQNQQLCALKKWQ